MNKRGQKAAAYSQEDLEQRGPPYLPIDQWGQPCELSTVLVLIVWEEGLVADAHGADVELLHSDITANCR